MTFEQMWADLAPLGRSASTGGYFRQPFATAEEEAQASRDRLDAGDVTFEALVEERGLRLSDIDLGDVSREDLDDAGEAIFAAATGDVGLGSVLRTRDE